MTGLAQKNLSTDRKDPGGSRDVQNKGRRDAVFHVHGLCIDCWLERVAAPFFCTCCMYDDTEKRPTQNACRFIFFVRIYPCDLYFGFIDLVPNSHSLRCTFTCYRTILIPSENWTVDFLLTKHSLQKKTKKGIMILASYFTSFSTFQNRRPVPISYDISRSELTDLGARTNHQSHYQNTLHMLEVVIPFFPPKDHRSRTSWVRYYLSSIIKFRFLSRF